MAPAADTEMNAARCDAVWAGTQDFDQFSPGMSSFFFDQAHPGPFSGQRVGYEDCPPIRQTPQGISTIYQGC